MLHHLIIEGGWFLELNREKRDWSTLSTRLVLEMFERKQYLIEHGLQVMLLNSGWNAFKISRLKTEGRSSSGDEVMGWITTDISLNFAYSVETTDANPWHSDIYISISITESSLLNNAAWLLVIACNSSVGGCLDVVSRESIAHILVSNPLI